MLTPVRRIVAGLDREGRSCVLKDSDATNAMENPNWPGFGVKLLWAEEATPVTLTPGRDGADRPFVILPERSGTTFVLCEFPPLADLARMSAQERAAAETLTFGSAGSDQSLRLHATPTLDYLVMLAGELTLILERGEITLHAGDVLIDCGVKHGWENRGSVPARCAVVMVPAQTRS